MMAPTKMMEFQKEQQTHYDTEVMVSIEIEKLRREHCLCLNCGSMKECAKAALLYNFCKLTDVAMAISRCPDFWAKGIDTAPKP